MLEIHSVAVELISSRQQAKIKKKYALLQCQYYL